MVVHSERELRSEDQAITNNRQKSFKEKQALLEKIITEDLSYKSEGAWLKNEVQKQFCQFANHKDGAQNELIMMHSFHWRPPDDPIPQGSQLMSRAEALQKWNSLKSMGWERCAGPLQ